MRRQLLITLVLLLAGNMACIAQPARSMSVLLEKAGSTLHGMGFSGEPRQLDAMGSCRVIGTADGGFVVMSADARQPLVLATSATAYSAGNQNFQWWLRAVSSLHPSPSTNYSPSTLHPSPSTISPLMSTRWQQEYPYNLLCPTGAGGTRCLTGCVATAMAQILAYHRGPRHGLGWRTIYYPSNNTAGQPVRACFEDHYYDWDHMAADYTEPGIGETQRLAVATLMRDCGVACNMAYGTTSSGSTLSEAADGLQRYFGIGTASYMRRSECTEEEWMNTIYAELSQGRPVLYGGMDPNPMAGISGHAFVLHGYDSEGRVYVNWGWGGLNDGYYDLRLLNPANMQFSTMQDMVIGISPQPFTPHQLDIAAVEPGTLNQRLDSEQASVATTLTLSGTLAPEDFTTLRHLYADSASLLEVLDLSQARFTADALPTQALSGCASLRRLVLPATISSWGSGALAGCRQLRQIEMPESDISRAYIIYNNGVYTPDTTVLIELLPTADGAMQLPRGVVSLGAEAASGCVRVSSLMLPASCSDIGPRALSHLRDLSELRTTARQRPTLAADALLGTDCSACHLYVLRGMKEAFAEADGWRAFTTADYDNIVEFGTTIKARNAMRPEGQPNPELGYQVIGDYVEGTPLLICDATPQSPPGRYAIHVLPGTIDSEAVDYVDGYLIVTAADAISTISTAPPCPTLTDLQGRRLKTKPTRSGLYIRNGKKTIIN